MVRCCPYLKLIYIYACIMCVFACVLQTVPDECQAATDEYLEIFVDFKIVP